MSSAPPKARHSGERPTPNWVPKRRVSVRVRFVDKSVLGGMLYADIQRLDGSRATVADRLHDSLERYVPLAVEGTHVLVRKDAVVAVELQEPDLNKPQTEGIREFEVEFRLAYGSDIRGKVYALLSPARRRVLDYLNSSTEQFVNLWKEDQLVLINSDFIVHVTELPEGLKSSR